MTVKQEKINVEEADTHLIETLTEKILAEDNTQKGVNCPDDTIKKQKEAESTESIPASKTVSDSLYPEETVMADSHIPGQVLQIRLMIGKILAMEELLAATDEQRKQYFMGEINAYSAILRYLYSGLWQ